MAQKLNTRTSVVDYLKSQGQDSSMASRTKLAGQYGITGYTGSYNQNVKLLSNLQQAGQPKAVATKPKAVPQVAPKATTTAKPKVTTPAPKATTTAPKTTTTTPKVSDKPVVVPPPNAPQEAVQQGPTAIQQQEKTLEQAMQEYKDFLKGNKDAYIDEQTAILDGAKEQRLIELQKAYDQAVADGKMSQEEAERQLEENVTAINEDAYMNAQVTNLSAESRGIGNSQQMLAMQQGDQRHTQSVMQEARTARDDRINDIKNRLSQITNNFELDKSATNSAYNSDIARANAQANQMYNQGMGDLAMGQIKSAQEMKNSLTMLDEQTRKQMEIMAQQQGYDLEKMSVQQQYQLAQMAQSQSYTKDNMKTQQQYTLEQFAKQHGYDLAKMSQAQKNDLAKMAKQQGYNIDNMNLQQNFTVKNMNTQQRHTLEQFAKQHGYDLAKMSVAQQNQLAQMATQNGYNVGMANLNFGHQQQLSQQEYSQAIQKAEHSAKLQIDAESKAYDEAVKRELAKYTKGSTEYEIRKGQLESERESMITEMHTKLMYDAQMSIALGGQTAHPGEKPTKKWYQTQGSYQKSLDEYNKKLKEYEKYQKAVSNPMSLFP